MSDEKQDSDILEEVRIFTDFALEQAKNELRDGNLPNVALLVHGGPEIETDEPVEGPAMVRILDQDGLLISEAELEAGQSPDDFVKGIVGDDFKAQNEKSAKLVAVIPFTPPTPVWAMTIGVGSKIVSAKFLTVVMETWVGSEGWTKAPSEDPNRKEALVVFSPYFKEDELEGVYSLMVKFTRNSKGELSFEKPMVTESDGYERGVGFGGHFIETILHSRGSSA